MLPLSVRLQYNVVLCSKGGATLSLLDSVRVSRAPMAVVAQNFQNVRLSQTVVGLTEYYQGLHTFSIKVCREI